MQKFLQAMFFFSLGVTVSMTFLDDSSFLNAWRFNYDNAELQKQYDSRINNEISILKNKVNNGFAYTQMTSGSMLPNFPVGEKLLKVSSDLYKPQIGDVVSFRCKNWERCSTPEETKAPENSIAHRWVRTDPNGCMHIEGDNQPDAWDTRDYGCLMPDEIEISGTIWRR